MSLLINAPPVRKNAPILPYAQYVNVSGSNPTQANVQHGCAAQKALSMSGGKKSRRKSKKSMKKKSNKSKKVRKSPKRKVRKSPKRKVRKSPKRKNSKRKSQKGGNLKALGSAPVKNQERITAGTELNNIPYSQGYTINETSSTDYGALASPIPHKFYEKCNSNVKLS